MKARAMKVLQESVNQRNKAEFDKLCQLASELKALEIFKFMRDNQVTINFSIDNFVHDSKTVTMVMAEQANDKAVAMLLDTFNADPKHAVEGYARVGRVEKVEEWMLKLDVREAAARGYGFANNEERVENMLARGAKVHSGIYGAARGGHENLVNKLLTHKDANIGAWHMAIEGYAHSEHIALAEALIIRTAEMEKLHEKINGQRKLFHKESDHLHNPCMSAIGAYAGTGTFNDADKFLKLLTLTENDAVRKQFTDFLRKQKHMIALVGTTMDQMVNKAGEIRAIMDESMLGYDDALAAHAAPKPAPAPVVVEEPKVEEPVVAQETEHQAEKGKDEPMIVVKEEPKAEGEVKEEPKAEGEVKEEPKAEGEAKEEAKAAVKDESKQKHSRFLQLFHLHSMGKRGKHAANDEVKEVESAAENAAVPVMKQ